MSKFSDKPGCGTAHEAPINSNPPQPSQILQVLLEDFEGLRVHGNYVCLILQHTLDQGPRSDLVLFMLIQA